MRRLLSPVRPGSGAVRGAGPRAAGLLLLAALPLLAPRVSAGAEPPATAEPSARADRVDVLALLRAAPPEAQPDARAAHADVAVPTDAPGLWFLGPDEELAWAGPGSRREGLAAGAAHLARHPSGDVLVTAGTHVARWSDAGGGPERRWEVDLGGVGGGPTLSADGSRWAAIVDHGRGTAQRYDLVVGGSDDGRVVLSVGHAGRLQAYTFDDRGGLFLADLDEGWRIDLDAPRVRRAERKAEGGYRATLPPDAAFEAVATPWPALARAHHVVAGEGLVVASYLDGADATLRVLDATTQATRSALAGPGRILPIAVDAERGLYGAWVVRNPARQRDVGGYARWPLDAPELAVPPPEGLGAPYVDAGGGRLVGTIGDPVRASAADETIGFDDGVLWGVGRDGALWSWGFEAAAPVERIAAGARLAGAPSEVHVLGGGRLLHRPPDGTMTLYDPGVVRRWTVPDPYRSHRAGPSAGGRTLAMWGQSDLHLLDAATGAELVGIDGSEGHVTAVAAHPTDPDVVALVGADGAVHVLRVSTGARIARSGPRPSGPAGRADSASALVATWLDDARIGVGYADGSARVWNTRTGLDTHRVDPQRLRHVRTLALAGDELVVGDALLGVRVVAPDGAVRVDVPGVRTTPIVGGARLAWEGDARRGTLSVWAPSEDATRLARRFDLVAGVGGEAIDVPAPPASGTASDTAADALAARFASPRRLAQDESRTADGHLLVVADNRALTHSPFTGARVLDLEAGVVTRWFFLRGDGAYAAWSPEGRIAGDAPGR